MCITDLVWIMKLNLSDISTKVKKGKKTEVKKTSSLVGRDVGQIKGAPKHKRQLGRAYDIHSGKWAKSVYLVFVLHKRTTHLRLTTKHSGCHCPLPLHWSVTTVLYQENISAVKWLSFSAGKAYIFMSSTYCKSWVLSMAVCVCVSCLVTPPERWWPRSAVWVSRWTRARVSWRQRSGGWTPGSSGWRGFRSTPKFSGEKGGDAAPCHAITFKDPHQKHRAACRTSFHGLVT